MPLCASRLTAQGCARTESRTNLAAFSGERVRSLDVATEHPIEHGIAAGLVGKLHRRTRTSAIRQRLLIAPGDLVDTARVAESLSRLRRLRFLDDVYLVAERCDGQDGVGRTDERDVAAPWRGTLLATDAARWPMFGAGGHFDRTALQALAGRRVTGDAASAAVYLSGGAELADAQMTRFDGVRTPGPASVAR